MLRPWGLPLLPLYGVVVGVKNRLYDAGVWKPRALGWPVMSVGSVSAGGAGKTPLVKMLAGLLERQGVGVDVLSRGYGRAAEEVEEVDAGGSAERFGDEPMEIARAGSRVFVGADRWAAGRLAESLEPRSELGLRVHLLDDGFQHRRLRRALDVVLLTAADAEDRLLPWGNLREPLRSLGRAEVVVLRAEEAERLRPLVARYTKAEVWVIRRELVLPERQVQRPVVFCGIARPDGFLRMLAEAGCAVVGQVVFRDHQRYGRAELERILAVAREVGADGFYTTAKDAVKLPPESRRRLEEVGPLEVAGLSVRLEDEAQAVATMLRAVRGDG